MATTTPNYGWPVPTSTDYVKDGALAIETLGDAIDATVFGLPGSGLTLINTTTFSAVASQSINDVFSATYTNYRLIVNASRDGASGVLLMRLRVGGVDNSSAEYNTNNIYMTPPNATVNGASGSGATRFYVGEIYNNSKGEMISDLSNPFVTDRTQYLYSSFANSYWTFGGGENTATTSYTGFTLVPLAGNISGSVSVYGYNK